MESIRSFPRPCGVRLSPAEADTGSLLRVFLFVFVSITVMQRFAIPGTGSLLGVGFVTCFAVFAIGVWRDLFLVSPQRLALFSGVVVALILTLFANIGGFSPLSFLMIIILYAPYIGCIYVSKEQYRMILLLFQKMMMFCSICGILQFSSQFVFGASAMFPLDAILPSSVLIRGFNLIIPISESYQYVKSTGLWFLEPSHFSQFIAFAIIIEFIYFKRGYIFIIFGISYLITFSGTGFMLIAAVSVLLAVQRRNFVLPLMLGIGLVCMSIFLYNMPPFSILYTRLAEFTNPQASGAMRFVGPFRLVEDVIANDPRRVVFGSGSGTMQEAGIQLDYKVQDASWLKLLTEYGLIGSIPLMIFYCYCLFRRSPDIILSWACLLQFLFLGGYLNAFYVQFLHMALVGWPRLLPPSSERRGDDRPLAVEGYRA